MPEDKKESSDGDRNYKNLYCTNPECRKLLSKMNTEGRAETEIKCPNCGRMNTFSFVVIRKIVDK